ncbi:disintegrin and metalloproteinase domain-containing protein 30-like [Petaurus breviceps papuanus]|uniref:disintegrin and metalloproteinase domain-containing protein 30-like n=1 Tax=Petaurus breviceps papuanus TaxID=3040969 RepID=UPI0036D9D35B
MGAATPGGSLLLLGLGTLILGGCCLAQDSVFNPDWGFTSYEVVIPRQLVTRGGGPEVASRTTYLLRIEGKKNIIHLRPKKLLLARHLRVFTFTEEGSGVEDQPYIPNNCNFRGSVEGAHRSEAVLSTCLGGLRGMLQIEDSVYQIEPIQASYSFEHVVYRLKDDFITNFTCGLTDQEIERQLSKLAPRAHSWTSSYIHQKYMEVMIVVDRLRYLFLGSNVTKAISDTIVMVGIMDTYFQVLNARIHLKAIEVWTDKSKVNVNVKKLIQVLGEFSNYRKRVLNPRITTDWSHLYVHKYFPDALGWAYVGSVCDRNFGASTSTLPNKNLVAPATWSAHEFGHGVGMPHDQARCYCQGKKDCIMGSGGRFGFSNCSFVSYYNHVTGKGECLDDVPGIPYRMKQCGNKVVERGEECDCGTVRQCKQDMCCQTNCKLKPGAQCSSGLCCTNCHFSPSGHVCRDKQNECDLVEFCNGTSNQCPSDFYMQDGTPCSREAHCYHKRCSDRFLQCKEIFGSGARNAPFICYLEVNRKTDRFGNCGLIGKGYRSCKAKDILCGRLQCVNVKNVPEMPDHTTVIFTHVKEFNIRCWGIDYHSGMVTMQLRDDGTVKDGTACGKNLICLNHVCRDISVLHYDCSPHKCNKRGVCNNLKHCHCNYGWAPPFCETPGYGGSIDSGPPGKREEIPKPVKVVPIMLIRLVSLGMSLVLVILKEAIGRFLKRKVKVVVHLAKKPLPKNKGEKRKKFPEKYPQPRK